jgi:hypothetical protein
MKGDAVRGISHRAVHGLGIDRPLYIGDGHIARRARGIRAAGTGATTRQYECFCGENNTKTNLQNFQSFHSASHVSRSFDDLICREIYV